MKMIVGILVIITSVFFYILVASTEKHSTFFCEITIATVTGIVVISGTLIGSLVIGSELAKRENC